MSAVLMKYGCGMTEPEFRVNHAHELECIVPVSTPEVVETLEAAGFLVVDRERVKEIDEQSFIPPGRYYVIPVEVEEAP